MTSYLCENEAENVQMAMSILFKILGLGWDISRTIWRIEDSDDSYFCIFHALGHTESRVHKISSTLSKVIGDEGRGRGRGRGRGHSNFSKIVCDD